MDLPCTLNWIAEAIAKLKKRRVQICKYRTHWLITDNFSKSRACDRIEMMESNEKFKTFYSFASMS